MSQARQIIKGKTFLFTRRTIFRHMLFRPDPRMNQIIAYLLAETARRHGMRVHAFCAMSDHLHMVATDVDGTLPSFLHAFHRMIALCTKELWGWDEVVWDKSPTSVVSLETREAVIGEIAYVIANPVAAGLVEHAHQWPGVKVLADEIGTGEIRACRPDLALKPKSWPAAAALPISLPPGVDPSNGAVFRGEVATQVEVLEARAHAEMQAQGRTFLGAKRACAISPESRATTPKPAPARNPTFAVGLHQKEAAKHAAVAVRAFRTAYRAALETWRAGVRDVVFPAGTWLMRVLHNAVVAAPAVVAGAPMVV